MMWWHGFCDAIHRWWKIEWYFVCVCKRFMVCLLKYQLFSRLSHHYFSCFLFTSHFLEEEYRLVFSLSPFFDLFKWFNSRKMSRSLTFSLTSWPGLLLCLFIYFIRLFYSIYFLADFICVNWVISVSRNWKRAIKWRVCEHIAHD